jgi:hypothetical protein
MTSSPLAGRILDVVRDGSRSSVNAIVRGLAEAGQGARRHDVCAEVASMLDDSRLVKVDGVILPGRTAPLPYPISGAVLENIGAVLENTVAAQANSPSNHNRLWLLATTTIGCGCGMCSACRIQSTKSSSH